jgi:hypothetical protein
MNTHDPRDVRARFLTAVERVPSDADGAARLCAACVLALPVRHAAIAIYVEGVGLEVLAATDQIAEQVEWTQITLGEGPGLDAVASGGPVSLLNLAQADGRWPMFVPEIAGSGIGAMYAMPLQVGAIKVGVLDLYCAPGDSLDGPDFADAVSVAELLTGVLLAVGPDGRIPKSLGPWWNQPLATREVHQATGMIMAQLGIDARSAYVRLQAFAFGNSQPLRDVARDVVGQRLRFNPDPDPNPDPDRLADT